MAVTLKAGNENDKLISQSVLLPVNNRPLNSFESHTDARSADAKNANRS